MQKDRKGNSMESKLREELEWYTLYASDEEYDEKAVESILYLLDRWEPLEEGTIPPVEESWKRFLAITDRKELLPVEDADVVLNAAQKRENAVQETEQGEAAAVRQEDLAEAHRVLEMRNGETESDSVAGAGKTVGRGKIRKLVQFASRHKVIAAAVLVLLILMVSNTVHVVAYPEAGFFFWMKRDDSGVQIITSPEGLNNRVDKSANIFYSKEDAPEWAKGWLQIGEGVEMPENYEWQYFEANELDNRKVVVAKYWNDDIKKEIELGVLIYADKISYIKEEFVGYKYIENYEISQKKMDIYSREQTDGKIYYIVSFYEGNSKYYVRGQDNLDELKILAEWYLDKIKNKF